MRISDWSSDVCSSDLPKNLIHHSPHAMHILIANLHKDAAAVGQQIPRHGEPVAQISEVAVDAVAPGVAKGFDLLGFAGDVVGVAVLHVAARSEEHTSELRH